jgi:hypothetical protein
MVGIEFGGQRDGWGMEGHKQARYRRRDLAVSNVPAGSEHARRVGVGLRSSAQINGG